MHKELDLALTVMKQEICSIENSVDPDQLAFEAS